METVRVSGIEVVCQKFRHLLQGDPGREQDHVPCVAGAGFVLNTLGE